MSYAIRAHVLCAAVVVASLGVFFATSSFSLEPAKAAESKSPTSYPRTLSGAEVTDHFTRNRSIEGFASGNVGLVKSFTLKLKSNGWYDGRGSTGWVFAGKWKVSAADSRLCLTHTTGASHFIDLTDCYVLQQTGERSFLLTGKDAAIRYNEGGGPVSAIVFGGAPVAAPIVREESAEPILIDISERKISAEAFKEIATKVLADRGWKITKADADLFEGLLIKDREYRVRILFKPGAMVKIAFVENYGNRSPSWLQNLKKDLELAMTTSTRL